MNFLSMLGLAPGVRKFSQPTAPQQLPPQNPLGDLRSMIMGAAQQPPAPAPAPDPALHGEGGEQVASGPHDYRGMFGLRGTARDILGTIGDAFLVQGGRDPLYYNRRSQERQSNALTGMADDPLAAAERLAREDPTAGRDMLNDTMTRNTAQDNANRLAEVAERERQDGVRQQAMRLLFRANQENYPYVLGEVRRYLQRNQTDLGVDLPEQWDEAQMGVLRYMGIDPDDQARMEDTREYRESLIDLSRQRNSLSQQREGRMERQGDRRGDQRDRDLNLKERNIGRQERQGDRRLEIQAQSGSRRRPRRSVRRINPDGTVVFN